MRSEEARGFEPPMPFGILVFKTSRFSHLTHASHSFIRGPYRARTGHLYIANVALYQMS